MGSIKDLTNQRFSHLTAIKQAPKPTSTKSKQLSVWWLCVCDCGKEKVVRSRELIAGETKSCGCKNKFEFNAKFKGIGRVSQTFYSRLVRGAEQRGLVVDVTKELLWELYQKQNKKCFFTGIPIQLNARDSKEETTASVDRLDSSKGYTEDNIVWVHKDVNLMKNAFPIHRFLYLCELITLKNKKQQINDVTSSN
jgi:hypothetical protein